LLQIVSDRIKKFILLLFYGCSMTMAGL